MNWRNNLRLAGLNDARERVDAIERVRERQKMSDLADRIEIALKIDHGGVSFDAEELKLIIAALRR